MQLYPCKIEVVPTTLKASNVVVCAGTSGHQAVAEVLLSGPPLREQDPEAR